MLTHKQVWNAIDVIAERYGFSASGLAKKSGLDPTSFNPSKRHGPDGRPRWPTMESISRLLQASGATVEEFADLLIGRKNAPARRKHIPVLGFAKAGKGGFFDDSGFPAGNGWDEIEVPGVTDSNAYALEITGDSMLPVYREGDTIVDFAGRHHPQGRPRGGAHHRWPGHGQDHAAPDLEDHRAGLLQCRPSAKAAGHEGRRLGRPHRLGQPMKRIAAVLVALAPALPDAALAQDTDVSIIAAQVRSQGFACDNPTGAERVADESAPDQQVYTLACDGVTYRVKLIPDMAAEITKID